MGYTHYWDFKRGNHSTEEINKRYSQAIKDCNKVIQTYNKRVKRVNSKNYERLSGYSAFSSKYGGIRFNGVGKYSHEDFCLRESFFQSGGDFCKTAQKPYDIVVVACLAVLKYRLKDCIDVSSDGDRTDWIDGVELAASILNRKTKNPIAISSRDFKLVG